MRKKISTSQAVAQLRHMPYEDLGFAKIDHHRALRQGFPEVIMGEGKTPKEIAAIVRALRRQKSNILGNPIVPGKDGNAKRYRSPGSDIMLQRTRGHLDGKPIKMTGKESCW